jgi:hypothetical protein
MAKVRVSIPVNVQEAIELAGMVRAKHLVDGENSPLNTLQDNNWTDISEKLDACELQHLKAEELRRQMELAYRERDAHFKPISETLKASRDLLMGVYRSQPKKLGDWGFKVSDSPSRMASRLRKVAAEAQTS